jgi:hypothetical protein
MMKRNRRQRQEEDFITYESSSLFDLCEIFADNSNNVREMTVPGTVFAETVGNLRPNKKYLFTLLAENTVGLSESSEVRVLHVIFIQGEFMSE